MNKSIQNSKCCEIFCSVLAESFLECSSLSPNVYTDLLTFLISVGFDNNFNYFRFALSCQMALLAPFVISFQFKCEEKGKSDVGKL